MNGPGPQPRHGHVMVAVENSVFIHGGMAGTNIFGDLWQLKISMCSCLIIVLMNRLYKLNLLIILLLFINYKMVIR